MFLLETKHALLWNGLFHILVRGRISRAGFPFEEHGSFAHDFADGQVLWTKTLAGFAPCAQRRLVFGEPPAEVDHGLRFVLKDMQLVVQFDEGGDVDFLWAGHTISASRTRVRNHFVI